MAKSPSPHRSKQGARKSPSRPAGKGVAAQKRQKHGSDKASQGAEKPRDRSNAKPAQPKAKNTPAVKAERRKPPSELRPEEGEQRIAKLLARAGVASRRESERMIADGRIKLNGTVVATPATLLTSLAGVTVDDAPVAAAEATRLFLFHKPAGCLTAERDFTGRKTIYDVLPKSLPRVMPIGRLDLNTEGLLLLTNDGALKRTMELPSTGVERSYRARAFGDISQDELESLIHGITVEGMHYGRIDANLERRTGRNQWIEMTLTEGKNREVRRVLDHLGLKVSRLIRTRYGPFLLGDLEKGEVGEVAERDLARFVRTLETGAAPEAKS